MDNKSWKSASLTCKYWLEVIRNDPKFSSHIVLKHSDLVDFQTKIENSEWIWERWPVCKEIEFGRCKLLAEELIDSVQLFKFDQCPNLEKVILNVAFDLEELHSSDLSTKNCNGEATEF